MRAFKIKILVLCGAVGLFLSPGRSLGAETYPAPATGYAAPVTSEVTPGYPAPATPAIPGGIIKGRVLEKGSRRPLDGVSVVLLPTEQYALTDQKGNFFLPVPPGDYRLTAVMVDFKKPEPVAIKLKPGEEKSLTIYLEKSFYSLMEVVVESKREKEVSEQVLQKVEAEKVAGTSGDIIRSIQSLPGVTTGGIDVSGALFVRGGGPDENLFLLDQAPIVNLFHFGGLYSTINPDLIQDIRFYSGGFGPEYSFKGGGVIDIDTRDGRKDRLGGKVNVNLLLANGQVEGPVTDQGSFFLSGRRSYIDLFPLGSGKTTVYPRFWDYQGKATWDFNEKNQVSFMAYGSSDTLVINRGGTDEEESGSAQGLNTDMYFHTQTVSLHSLLSPGLSLRLTAYNNIDWVHFELGNDLYINYDSNIPGLKGYLEWDAVRKNRLRLGTDFQYVNYGINGKFIQIPTEGTAVHRNLRYNKSYPLDLHDNTSTGGVWLEDEITLGKLKLIPGGRWDFLQILNEWSNFSPRFRFIYALLPDLRLKGASGIYYQTPSPAYFLPPIGNPKIDSIRVIHYVLGMEKDLGQNFSFDVQGYYKDYLNLVAESQVPGEIFNNKGKGYATGLDFFLRHRLSRRFFGWLTYSFCRSKRKWPGQEAWVPSVYEQPHSIALVLNYQLTSKWNLGTQWRYQSGMHYTPLKAGWFDADIDRFVPIAAGKLYSATYPDYQRLDFRVERQFVYQTWKMGAYLEVQNVYMHKNVVGMAYTGDYSYHAEFYWIPILPFLGVEAEF